MVRFFCRAVLAGTYQALACFHVGDDLIRPQLLRLKKQMCVVFVRRACKNRHVVRLYEVYETPDNVYIVLENCPCGDLEKMLYLRG